jgi:hypothetical protein
MSIVVTGACGRIGTALLDHQNDQFDYSPFDRQRYPHSNTIEGDVAEYDIVYNSFESMDAVVHLAADSDVSGDWDSVLRNNIIGGYNCLEASRQQRIDTVVLASSNHVVGMYETEHAPDIYHPDYEFMLDHTVPVRPDSFYATSKVFLEALGRYYVENYSYPNHVYALRIGSVRSSKYDNPFGDAERGVDNGKWSRGSEKYNRKLKRMKAMWQSRRDIATLIECCLQDDSVSFEIFYGVSDNKRRWLDIKHAKDIIGYDPTDSADDWDHPPSISSP